MVTGFRMIGAQALTSTTAEGAVAQDGAVLLILLVVKVVAEGLVFLEIMLELLVQPIPEEVGEALMVQVDRIGPALVAVRE